MIVLITTRIKDSSHLQVLLRFRALEGKNVSYMNLFLLRQSTSNHADILILHLLFVHPGAFRNIPPASKVGQACVQLLSCRQRHVMVEPASCYQNFRIVLQGSGRPHEGGIIHDVECPENGLDLSQFLFLKIRTTVCSTLHIVEVADHRALFRHHRNVSAVGFQFLIDFISDIQNHTQHCSCERSAQCDRDGNQDHFFPLSEECSSDHSEKHK